MNKAMYRQGDVLIEAISQIPTKAKKSKSNILALGEGHHQHEVFGDVEVMESDSEKYLVVNSSGVIEHVLPGTRTKAEHNPIEIPAGNYKVIQQREYDPYEDLIREVRD